MIGLIGEKKKQKNSSEFTGVVVNGITLLVFDLHWFWPRIWTPLTILSLEMYICVGWKLIKKINKPFFVSNCDTIIKEDYRKIYDFHQKSVN